MNIKAVSISHVKRSQLKSNEDESKQCAIAIGENENNP